MNDKRVCGIAANTADSLGKLLPDADCRSRPAIPMPWGTGRPDVAVLCGDGRKPALVVEIVSEGAFESHRKVFGYRSHPDILHILLIDAGEPRAILHSRNGTGWAETLFEGVDAIVGLPGVGIGFPLGDAYRGLGSV